MARRIIAVALGIVSILLFGSIADWLLHAIFAPRGYLPTLLVSLPLAAFGGAIVTAFKADEDARAAGTIYSFAYNSWLTVPIFTLADRPPFPLATCVLLVNIGATVGGGFAGRLFLPLVNATPLGQRRLRNASARRVMNSPFRRGARLVLGSILGCYFLWVSFEHASFWLGTLAVASYAFARSALEVGNGSDLITRNKILNRGLGYIDKFAFACAIGVIVRSSAAQTYKTNSYLAEEARSGRATRLDVLEPDVKATLIAQRDEYLRLKHDFLDADEDAPMSKLGAAALLACADRGNPHCQVMIGMCYRDGDGVERDLDKARHYTWLALRDNHHPIALNNMVVYAHEAAPEPYSELLTKTQDPETIDRIRGGCGK